MSNKFKIDGSLNVENLVVENNLQVKGSTQTVDQETLTIKDNLIAVNGPGQRLDTVGGIAGLVAVNGVEQYKLKDGVYMINENVIFNLLEIEYADTNYYHEAVYDIKSWNEEQVNKFNNLNLWVQSFTALDDSLIEYPSQVFIDPTQSGYKVGIYIGQSLFFEIANIGKWIDSDSIVIDSCNSKLTFKNQLVKASDIDYLNSFLLHEDGSLVTIDDYTQAGGKTQAYAAPIYDQSSDSLKIGSGFYDTDENGNIISFEFGAGQGQSLATRADEIGHGNILIWDDNSKKIIDSGKKGYTQLYRHRMVFNRHSFTHESGYPAEEYFEIELITNRSEKFETTEDVRDLIAMQNDDSFPPILKMSCQQLFDCADISVSRCCVKEYFNFTSNSFFRYCCYITSDTIGVTSFEEFLLDNVTFLPYEIEDYEPKPI